MHHDAIYFYWSAPEANECVNQRWSFGVWDFGSWKLKHVWAVVRFWLLKVAISQNGKQQSRLSALFISGSTFSKFAFILEAVRTPVPNMLYEARVLFRYVAPNANGVLKSWVALRMFDFGRLKLNIWLSMYFKLQVWKSRKPKTLRLGLRCGRVGSTLPKFHCSLKRVWTSRHNNFIKQCCFASSPSPIVTVCSFKCQLTWCRTTKEDIPAEADDYS